MNCHEAREGIPALFHGGMGLTEWALLDAHLRQCVECQKEQACVQEVLTSRQQLTPSRALVHCLSKVIDAIHVGITSFRELLLIPSTVAWPRSRRVIEANRAVAIWLLVLLTRVCGRLPKCFTLFRLVPARVIGATGFVITKVADLLARLRLSLTIAFHGAARAAIETACAGVTRVVTVFMSVRYLLPVLSKLSERVVATVIKATRFASIRFADLLTRLLAPLSISWNSRIGVMWLIGLLMRGRRLLPLLFALSQRAAIRAIGTMWGVGRILVKTSGRAVSVHGLGVWMVALGTERDPRMWRLRPRRSIGSDQIRHDAE